MLKDTSCGRGKDVFYEKIIIGMHQSEKISKGVQKLIRIAIKIGRIVGTIGLEEEISRAFWLTG